MVNRGEEKVRVHMNVVPRSTMNTIPLLEGLNGWGGGGVPLTVDALKKVVLTVDG